MFLLKMSNWRLKFDAGQLCFHSAHAYTGFVLGGLFTLIIVSNTLGTIANCYNPIWFQTDKRWTFVVQGAIKDSQQVQDWNVV